MADKPAIYSWTEDPSGQQWFFSSSGWTQVSGTSGDGFVEWDSITEEHRPTYVGQDAYNSEATEQSNAFNNFNQTNNNSTVKETVKLNFARPRAGTTVGSEAATVRYPSSHPITTDTDYVSIDFYNYQPPFGNIPNTNTDVASAGEEGNNTSQIYENYHHSIGDNALKEKAKGYRSILLFMPEDVQAQFGANWGGQGIGVGQANFASMIGTKTKLKDIGDMWGGTWEAGKGGLKIGGYNLAKTMMNASMGGHLTTDQLMGGVSGQIINPNVELMYAAPELRGMTLNFKMMARSPQEGRDIFTICQTMKKAMLPSWGGDVKGMGRSGALLTIPKIVSVKFMTGNKLNPYVTQYKPCAITNVNINYTPDGSYATYEDGSPVATMLQVQFKELKLVFEDEIPLSDVPIASY
mgnify:CR=1 FL=1|tara:strand:- start:653 stop:1876 length:1224 start_codon:yes stop_codon:yes gene_type:complete